MLQKHLKSVEKLKSVFANFILQYYTIEVWKLDFETLSVQSFSRHEWTDSPETNSSKKKSILGGKPNNYFSTAEVKDLFQR